MSSDSQVLRELRDRMVRVESRLVAVADALGIEVRRTPKIGLECDIPGVVGFVWVDGLDVSLGQVISTCHEQRMSGILVDIYRNGRKVGSVQT